MGLSRSLIAGSILCVFVSASLVPACAQTEHGEPTEARGSGNALQFVPGVLKAISDAKKRKDARRKAAAERAREEQQQEQQPVDNAASAPEVPPVVERPVVHPQPVHRPKPRPHRRTPPITQPVLTPSPVPAATVPPPAVTQPSLATTPAPAPPAVAPRLPAMHVKPAGRMPKIVAPAEETHRGWLLIFLAVAAAGGVGAAGYLFRGALGFVPPPPAARAFADSGMSSAPVFEKDGPQISFMIALPAFTTTSDYPEPAK